MGQARGGSAELGAIVLTGGTAVRLDGADKASIEVGGRTLLDRALDALVDFDDVVVVGPHVITERPVTFRQEDPPHGGPAAGIVAGLSGFPRLPRRIAILAVDLARVTAATFRRLTLEYDADGALLVDTEGRRQPLCGLYDGAMLAAAGAGDTHGMSMRTFLSTLDLVEVPAIAHEADDVDTWADVRALREQFEPERRPTHRPVHES